MYRQTCVFIFSLLFISIVTAQDHKKKSCIRNLVINGTNLVAAYRKQLLVLGIINFNNPSSRIQANRFNELFRELQDSGIRESGVRLILVNEQEAARHFPGNYYDKIRLYQDNAKDRFVKKLRNRAQNADNFLFGRCGYLMFTQAPPHSNIDDGKNYKDLLRNIKSSMRNKRSCRRMCS